MDQHKCKGVNSPSVTRESRISSFQLLNTRQWCAGLSQAQGCQDNGGPGAYTSIKKRDLHKPGKFFSEIGIRLRSAIL